jgi:hypothetical protein
MLTYGLGSFSFICAVSSSSISRNRWSNASKFVLFKGEKTLFNMPTGVTVRLSKLSKQESMSWECVAWGEVGMSTYIRPGNITETLNMASLVELNKADDVKEKVTTQKIRSSFCLKMETTPVIGTGSIQWMSSD